MSSAPDLSAENCIEDPLDVALGVPQAEVEPAVRAARVLCGALVLLAVAPLLETDTLYPHLCMYGFLN